MSYFWLKSILASVLMVCALGAALSMLSVMGRAEKKMNPLVLRKIHKISGWLFLALLLPLLVLGMGHWARIGDQASPRAVFHAVLAWGLIMTVLLKVAIARFYKQFLRVVPSLGMLVSCLAFVVFMISAGFHLVRVLSADEAPSGKLEVATSEIVGNARQGALLFNTKCASCHHGDSEEKKIGPGLKDLFRKEKLPHSGHPATVENVKRVLIRPILTMPSFANLTDQEIANLIAYLKTL